MAYTLSSQRNMKIHAFAALFVSIFAMLTPLGLVSRITILLFIALVFAAELLNTALEAVVNLATTKYHKLAKIAKDTAAGAVLAFAVGAVFAFSNIIIANWSHILSYGQELALQAPYALLLLGLYCWALCFKSSRLPSFIRRAAFAILLILFLDNVNDWLFFALIAVLIVLVEYSQKNLFAKKVANTF